jgi:ribosome-binding protein aMBF1 (putative translation factor)
VNELLDHLKQDFQSEEARYAYSESVANAYVSEQIKRLREDRGLSQEDLAALIGTKQSGISRLQSKDYSAWKVETLRKLAKAFGVRLRISFEEFGTITDDIAGFNEGNLVPRKFSDDPIFKPSATDKNIPWALRNAKFS